jgi:hypothetical protein
MRKFALVLILALALPAAAVARNGDKGDGTLVVKNGRGQLTVNARGSALGRIDDGTIAILDRSLDGSDDIQVIGADAPKIVRADGTTVYTGTRMRYRIVGGPYFMTITGKGIAISAVGKGTIYGIPDLTEGSFSADGAAFKPFFQAFGAQFGLQ